MVNYVGECNVHGSHMSCRGGTTTEANKQNPKTPTRKIDTIATSDISTDLAVGSVTTYQRPLLCTLGLK